jgi:hypothetical protein
MTQGEAQEREARKEDFRYKIALLAKSSDMYGLRPPISEGKTLSTMDYVIYQVIIHALIDFAINRKFEGPKPRWIVSSSASPSSTPETKETGDMLYMPHNEPKNHQVMFDTLKKYDIVPEDSDISQYDFLFDFSSAVESRK